MDDELRIPSNGSISMNLNALETRTKVTFSPELSADSLILNGNKIKGAQLNRVSDFLDRVRKLAGQNLKAEVISDNNFPLGAGIASSASAFSALALASTKALDLKLDEASLSRLARTGSGSACRSIPAGFVEWYQGGTHESSFAESIAPPDYWNLVDCIVLVSEEHKPVSSSEGHKLAVTSPIQASRLENAPLRLEKCRKAILDRDFEAFFEVIELDSNLMHTVMITSTPALHYWTDATVKIMRTVKELQRDGFQVSFTIDAGPNVHVICPEEISQAVKTRMKQIDGVLRVITATPGGGARIVDA